MLVSVHIPKTAGTTFRSALGHAYGGRLFLDYGDHPEANAASNRANIEARRLEMLGRAGDLAANYDAVHGHFLAGKYLRPFPDARLVTFVRDPYQHAYSTYYQGIRNPAGNHPGLREIHELSLSPADVVRTYPNLQTLYFNGLSINQFFFVGLTEAYELSLALLAEIGLSLPRNGVRENVNPAKVSQDYAVDIETRRAVDLFRSDDIKLYDQVRLTFDRLLRRHRL